MDTRLLEPLTNPLFLFHSSMCRRMALAAPLGRPSGWDRHPNLACLPTSSPGAHHESPHGCNE
ncbi:hypothetical protein GGTG_09717 [Gaeumannomyces tritici R3-111a-1]|uniref:Uncharacterized protein n=1 Tax=Gaeumannomyces tritici (strain R3-111a-1) TaxID=644352 RepID=J3P882_GAET3|nr:hypothetical protein GGTG_09717 [Gaeumannomyces tritici R3-111a-1]EJT72865.1 hypothetical protein GGTG_09717 [Gaeumannomyces tritici R3-111a-1]